MNQYNRYLKEKCDFLEKQVENIMDRFNRGGTLLVFPPFEAWCKSENASQQAVEADESKCGPSHISYKADGCHFCPWCGISLAA